MQKIAFVIKRIIKAEVQVSIVLSNLVLVIKQKIFWQALSLRPNSPEAL
jgi:hypothetical protein